jgi:hypothetical protein
MKIIRRILLIMAAPALILAGLHEIGGTSISKGSETEFIWHANPSQGQLVLSADPGGTMNCWLRVKAPPVKGKITASTESIPLFVKVTADESGDEWIEITKTATEDYFDWRSGRDVIIQIDPKPAQLSVEDWQVFPSAKAPDSKTWAQWRHGLFVVSLILWALVLVGAILEAVEKYGAKPAPFTSQRCVEQMIDGFEGNDDKQSEQNRKFLRKLLLEGASVEEALAPLNLNKREQLAMLLRIKGPFLFKLQSHLDHLSRLSKRLS